LKNCLSRDAHEAKHTMLLLRFAGPVGLTITPELRFTLPHAMNHRLLPNNTRAKLVRCVRPYILLPNRTAWNETCHVTHGVKIHAVCLVALRRNQHKNTTPKDASTVRTQTCTSNIQLRLYCVCCVGLSKPVILVVTLSCVKIHAKAKV
jgi:hypothetical protein